MFFNSEQQVTPLKLLWLQRLFFYLASGDGCCGVVNRDVVKLEVDLHGEKKPPCFPFPVTPEQKRDAWVCLQWNRHTRKVWLFQVPAK